MAVVGLLKKMRSDGHRVWHLVGWTAVGACTLVTVVPAVIMTAASLPSFLHLLGEANGMGGLATWFSGLGTFLAAYAAVTMVVWQNRQKRAEDQEQRKLATRVVAASYMDAFFAMARSARKIASEINGMRDKDEEMRVYEALRNGRYDVRVPMMITMQDLAPYLTAIDPSIAAEMGRALVRAQEFNARIERHSRSSLSPKAQYLANPEQWFSAADEVSIIGADLGAVARRLRSFSKEL